MKKRISKRSFEGTQLVCVGAGDWGVALYPLWSCPLGRDRLPNSLLLCCVPLSWNLRGWLLPKLPLSWPSPVDVLAY